MAAETVSTMTRMTERCQDLTAAQTKDVRLAFQMAAEIAWSSTMAPTMGYVLLGVEIGSKNGSSNG
jgi:hypothetical protein